MVRSQEGSLVLKCAFRRSSSTKEDPERLVIDYPDENCLRDLIAAPSIIELGFTSRVDALASLQHGRAEAAAWQQKRRTTGAFHRFTETTRTVR